MTLGEQFREWDVRGRGIESYRTSVWPEPALKLPQYFQHAPARVDDGRRENWFTRTFEKKTPLEPRPEQPADDTPDAYAFSWPSELAELHLRTPREFESYPEESRRFLIGLEALEFPFSFEVLGYEGVVETRVTTAREDRHVVERTLEAVSPTARVSEVDRLLADLFDEEQTSVLTLGLSSEFVRPLRRFESFRIDPLAPIITALSSLGDNSVGLLQILAMPVQGPWGDAAVLATTDINGKPLFGDAPELAGLSKDFAEENIFATVIRVALQTETPEERWRVLKEMLSGLSQFRKPGSNELIPLTTGFNDVRHVLNRTSDRTGMLLSSSVLSGFVHLPNMTVVCPALTRLADRTKRAPLEAQNQHGIYLGDNEHLGDTVEVRLGTRSRLRHCHLVGASGTGKSTAMASMILQDIDAGHGVAVLEPHGDLIDEVLARIPEERIDDVILFDPADPETVVGWNILGANSDSEREMLSSDLVAVFRRMATSWGDRMTSVMSNAVLTFLDSTQGGTLSDLRMFLIDPAWRAQFLTTVSDDYLRSYWELLSDN